VLDYDDLLLEGKRLLTEHEELRQRLSERYRYIMVDEYQDTNHLQAELVRLLAYTHNNVMAVGDDCQSIYSFRGADFRNIMDFPQLFPGTHIVKLEENYRSTQPVLDLANAVIAEAREKYTKCLFCIKKGGVKPQLVKTGTENEQSHLVVSQVQEWQRQGMPLRQIAVLFRAAYHSFDLEIELARAGVRFMKFGGFKFMESAHIKDLLSYLRVVANPRDTLSWQRLLTLVPGVGRQTAGKLTAGAADSAGFSGVVEKMAQHRQAGLKNLAETLARLQDPAQTIISRLSQALDHYEPLMQNRFDDFPRRQRDLEHLLTITSRYDDLRGFLNDFTLDPPASLADITNPVHEYLSLSTIHSAKGLEWEAVIIIWAAEGRFPSFYSFEKEAEEEEERRLMYVAVTRAKSQLTIIYPSLGYSRQFGMQYNSPSRFVAQVPRRVLERWKADPYD
jgi:DNA helicase-2/ATP-dependent DNA helicase PcrA